MKEEIERCKNSFGKNARLKQLKEFVGDKSFYKAIELGCKEGWLIYNVNAKEKIGYDLNPQKLFDSINYQKKDILDLKEDNADLVICSEVIEHIEDDRKAIENMYNQLKERGYLFLTTINSSVQEDKSEKDRERGHLRRYGKELKSLLENVGFKTIKFRPMRSSHYYIWKRLGNIANYNCSVDEIIGENDASGWVYFGVKE